MLRISLLLLIPAALLLAQDGKLRVIAFGAHPDDCDIRAGGTAAKFHALGYAVKFVSVTNGDAGHQSEGGGALAKRRRAEAEESGRRLGITYEVLDNHDGELLPTINVREQIIRQIRQWKADIVLAPRPNDYHPDHRYTGVLVEDAAYMGRGAYCTAAADSDSSRCEGCHRRNVSGDSRTANLSSRAAKSSV